jgi:hypothetical protein
MDRFSATLDKIRQSWANLMFLGRISVAVDKYSSAVDVYHLM